MCKKRHQEKFNLNVYVLFSVSHICRPPTDSFKLNCTTPMMFVTSLGDNPKKKSMHNTNNIVFKDYGNQVKGFFTCAYVVGGT